MAAITRHVVRRSEPAAGTSSGRARGGQAASGGEEEVQPERSAARDLKYAVDSDRQSKAIAITPMAQMTRVKTM